MSSVTRSKGAPGPWLVDDEYVTVDGIYDGPGVDISGEVTVDGGGGGDVVNVAEVATLVTAKALSF